MKIDSEVLLRRLKRNAWKLIIRAKGQEDSPKQHFINLHLVEKVIRRMEKEAKK